VNAISVDACQRVELPRSRPFVIDPRIHDHLVGSAALDSEHDLLAVVDYYGLATRTEGRVKFRYYND